MLNRWRERRRRREAAATLYDAIVEQARRPAFYAALGVPDTMLGRYEMVCLHAFLVFRRLGRAGAEGQALSQDIHDRMFADFDRTLREVGIGDMGIGKRIKKLAKNLYGRIAAYEAGLTSDGGELDAAIRRNVYAGAEVSQGQIDALAAYMHRAAAALETQDATVIMAGGVSFPEPEAAPAPPARETA